MAAYRRHQVHAGGETHRVGGYDIHEGESRVAAQESIQCRMFGACGVEIAEQDREREDPGAGRGVEQASHLADPGIGPERIAQCPEAAEPRGSGHVLTLRRLDQDADGKEIPGASHLAQSRDAGARFRRGGPPVPRGQRDPELGQWPGERGDRKSVV